MDSNNNQYEKAYTSNRKTSKLEAKLWKDRKLKTYKQFAYFRYRVGKDYEQTLSFLVSYFPEAWKHRHEDETVKDNLREALNLTIYLRHLHNNLK